MKQCSQSKGGVVFMVISGRNHLNGIGRQVRGWRAFTYVTLEITHGICGV